MIFGKKQNTIRINWYEVDYLNLRFAPDTDLYAISQGNLLFYLGKAYEQLVATRVVQSIGEHGFDIRKIKIWLGYIDWDNSTYSRKSKQLINDIECLLIIHNQPISNTLCTKSYNGRDDLKIISKSFPLVNKKVSTESPKRQGAMLSKSYDFHRPGVPTTVREKQVQQDDRFLKYLPQQHKKNQPSYRTAMRYLCGF